jgi:hypothetical protein
MKPPKFLEACELLVCHQLFSSVVMRYPTSYMEANLHPTSPLKSVTPFPFLYGSVLYPTSSLEVDVHFASSMEAHLYPTSSMEV